MPAFLKYQFTCEDDDKCGKTYIILTQPDESLVPDTCPFCGEKAYESIEASGDEE